MNNVEYSINDSVNELLDVSIHNLLSISVYLSVDNLPQAKVVKLVYTIVNNLTNNSIYTSVRNSVRKKYE